MALSQSAGKKQISRPEHGNSRQDLIDILGREVVSVRPRCATLGLSILKSAARDHVHAGQHAAAAAQE